MKNLSNTIFLFFIIISSYTAKAQESKNFAVKNFSGVSVSSGINLYLTQGNSESVTVKADGDLINDIVVEQENGNISIKFKEGFKWTKMFNNKVIKAYVNYKTLNSIAASGGSDVYTQNQMKTDKLAIRSSGGADVKLDLVCTDISIQSSGGSDISLKGKATNMTIQSSGGSDVDAYEFITDYAKVQTSGGADVDIYVNKGLEAAASGGGDISYKGNAALKKTSNSKSGDVHHVN